MSFIKKFQQLVGFEVRRINKEMAEETHRGAEFLRQQSDRYGEYLGHVGRESLQKIQGKAAEQARIVNATGTELIAVRPKETGETGGLVVFAVLFFIQIITFKLLVKDKEMTELARRFFDQMDGAGYWPAVIVILGLPVLVLVAMKSTGVELTLKTFVSYIQFLCSGVVMMALSGFAFAWLYLNKGSFTGILGLSDEGVEICGTVLFVIAPFVILVPLFMKFFPVEFTTTTQLSPPTYVPTESVAALPPPRKQNEKKNIILD